MTPTRAIARPMLAGIFIYGGIDALRHPEGKAPRAEDVGPAIAGPLGLPTDPVTLVRINGAAQVVGGTLLALGKMPRLAAMALASSLVPTTYAGHRFWEEEDQATRSQQQMHFLKNTAIVGGLILAATDIEGRPSMSWRTRRALKRTKGAGKATAKAQKRARRGAKDTQKRASKGAKVAMTAVAVATPRAAERARAMASKAEHVVADQSRVAARQVLSHNGARQKLPLAS